MRISLTEWAATHFSPSVRPSMGTLRAWAAAGLITDCRKVAGQWTATTESVYCDQPDSIPADSTRRVADILRAA